MQHDFRKPKRMDVAPGATPSTAKTAEAEIRKPSGHSRSGFLKRKWKLLVIIVAVLLVGGLGYAYVTTRNELSRLSNPSAAAEADAKKLASDVGRFLELPQDETPTIATVSDASLLKEQAFFSRAEKHSGNG